MWIFRQIRTALWLSRSRPLLALPAATGAICATARRCFASSGALSDSRTCSIRNPILYDGETLREPPTKKIAQWNTILEKIHQENIDDDVRAYLRGLQRPLPSIHGIKPSRISGNDKTNMTELQALRGKLQPFETYDFIHSYCGSVWSPFVRHKSAWTEGGVQSCTKLPEYLSLKCGAQVVLLKHLHPSSGLYKGARGVVTGFLNAPVGEYENVVRSESAFGVFANFPHGYNWPLVLPTVKFVQSEGQIIIRPWLDEDIINFLNANTFVPDTVRFSTQVQLPLDLAWVVRPNQHYDVKLDYAEVSLKDCRSLRDLHNLLSSVRGPDAVQLSGDLGKLNKLRRG